MTGCRRLTNNARSHDPANGRYGGRGEPSRAASHLAEPWSGDRSKIRPGMSGSHWAPCPNPAAHSSAIRLTACTFSIDRRGDRPPTRTHGPEGSRGDRGRARGRRAGLMGRVMPGRSDRFESKEMAGDGNRANEAASRFRLMGAGEDVTPRLSVSEPGSPRGGCGRQVRCLMPRSGRRCGEPAGR
jgi:hypothetical protein